MRSYARLFLFLTIVFCFSCEEQGWIVKCPDCTAEEPVKTDLEIKIDIATQGVSVVINVFEGNLEDSVLYKTFSASGTRTTTPVTINKKYAVTASYYIYGNHYIAVDSAFPKVRYDKYTCDDPCYFVYDRVVDLRLKHTK